MVLDSAGKAFSGLFAAHSRSVVLKSLGLTVLLFFGVWLGLQNLVSVWLLPMIEGWAWLSATVLWLLGAGVVVTGAILIAPVTALFAGIFLDDIAAHIEQQSYPHDPPGRPMPTLPSLLLALKFGIYVLIANLIALLLVWLAGFGVIVFFLVNGYLLGQEYFQFAAMRHRREADMRKIARKHSLEIFLSGLVIAGFLSIPLLNLLTPVFAAGLMVHLHKAISDPQPE